MNRAASLILSAIFAGFVSTANAVPITFIATLTGPNESPPNASPGTGFADVIFDFTANSMHVQVSFSGLSGTTTASHIHCCTAVAFVGTAGVATTTPTFTAFPLGVTSGTYDHIFDMTQASSYNPSFVTAQGSVPAAELALFNGMLSGHDYLNVHSTIFPGGEIRGFLVPVPEPPTLPIFLSGLLLVGLWGVRRRISLQRLIRRTR